MQPAFGSAFNPPLATVASGDVDALLTAMLAEAPIVAYDTNDLSAYFLDAGGGTPATINGIVGLQYDKSLGLAVGPDDRQAGTLGLVGTATAATFDETTGVGTVSRVDASNQSYVQFTGLTPHTFYRFTFSANSGGSTALCIGGPTGTLFATIASGQTGSRVCVSDASGNITLRSNTAGVTNSFTLTSVNSVAGKHRYQPTTGNKPILRGTPTGADLLAGKGAFSDPGDWTVFNGASITGGAYVADGIASTAQANTSLAVTSGRVYRITYTVLDFVSGNVRIQMTGGTFYGGPVRSANGTYTEYFTAAGDATTLRISGGTTPGLKVDNLTVFDVTADAVAAPYFLHYDGVDDFMQTASVNLTATDEVTVCQGVRKLSDAASGAVLEFSTITTNPGSFALFAPAAVNANVTFNTNGSALAQAVYANAAVAAPVTLVATGIADISSDTALLRINGVQRATSAADQGTGNYGNYVLYFGRRGGTAAPFNGLDFGCSIYPVVKSGAGLTAIEAFHADRTGVTL